MAEALTSLLFTCRDNLQANLRTVEVRHHRAITTLVDCFDYACVASSAVRCQNICGCFPGRYGLAALEKSFLKRVCKIC